MFDVVVMFSIRGFFAGVSSVLSFGLPCSNSFGSRPDKALSEDWFRAGRDLHKAVEKFTLEKKNDKTQNS